MSVSLALGSSQSLDTVSSSSPDQLSYRRQRLPPLAVNDFCKALDKPSGARGVQDGVLQTDGDPSLNDPVEAIFRDRLEVAQPA